MPKLLTRPRFRSIALALLAIFTLVSMAAFADMRLESVQNQPISSGMMFRFLGKATEVVGDAFYQRADIYFHGGVTTSAHDDEKRGPLLRNSTDVDEHADYAENQTTHISDNWIRRLNQRIKVQTHKHLASQTEEAEILPWLWAATQLNPHHIEAIMSVAYWLGYRLDKVEDAIQILEQGKRDNPKSWRLCQLLADLHFEKTGNYQSAALAYHDALTKALHSALDEVDQRILPLMHYRLAESLMRTKQMDAALRNFVVAKSLLSKHNDIPLLKVIEARIADIKARNS